MVQIVDRPSPNFDPRPGGGAIDMLILHYTGMTSAEAALERMCDPASKVSAHYLIDEAGELFQLVEERHRAWHAGVSSWQGDTGINARSVGIELVNPGHEFGYRAFTGAQMARLTALATGVLQRHPMPAHHVLGHSDVAPDRKQDPGELFDWASLARAGVGVWPDGDFRARRAHRAHRAHRDSAALHPGDQGPEVAALQAALKLFGYGIEDDGSYGDRTRSVVTAFQRHFRPRNVDGVADPETRDLIGHMAALASGPRN